ncbi:MAG: hypothetical protein WD049_04785 [Candidatus Paceibacterota bacterium]
MTQRVFSPASVPVHPGVTIAELDEIRRQRFKIGTPRGHIKVRIHGADLILIHDTRFGPAITLKDIERMRKREFPGISSKEISLVVNCYGFALRSAQHECPVVSRSRAG